MDATWRISHERDDHIEYHEGRRKLCGEYPGFADGSTFPLVANFESRFSFFLERSRSLLSSFIRSPIPCRGDLLISFSEEEFQFEISRDIFVSMNEKKEKRGNDGSLPSFFLSIHSSFVVHDYPRKSEKSRRHCNFSCQHSNRVG